MKKTFFKLTAIIICAVSILTATNCASTETVESTRVAASRVYQDYKISGNRDETRFFAVFRVGDSTGATIDLDAPSEIYLDGKLMRENAPGFMSGTGYSAAEKNFSPPHEYVFTDADGKIYRNTIALEALEFSVAKPPVLLQRSQTNLVPLSRIPFDKNEKVEIILSNTDFEKDEKKQVNINLPAKFDAAKKNLIIESEELRKFPVGKATISMSVDKTHPLEQRTAAGGQANVHYSAAPLEVRLGN